MTKEETSNLSKEIESISSNFEPKPWTDNVKLLRNDFDINTINTPEHYSHLISEISELLRETRVLFIYSVLNKVCLEDGKLYPFDSPFQASIKYTAVMKKEASFYILDEEDHFREIFTSENFTQFIEDQYWELYEQ